MAWTGEIFQSAGSQALYIRALEAAWGIVNGSPNWRRFRLLPGESIDRGQEVIRSREMRSDAMPNASVLAGQNPGGSLPFEVSPNGWNDLFWHLLGGTVITTGPVAGLAAPGAPTATPAGTGGTLPAGTTYQYKITAFNIVGETLPGAANAAATTTGTTSKITLTWAAVPGAVGYRVYGRTTGSFLFMATVGGSITSWVDNGSITPAGAVPGSDGSGSVYTHVITGSVNLPVGFTIEKGFTDQPIYIPYYGNRVGRLQCNIVPNQIVGGTWDILGRQEGDPSQTSLNVGSVPTAAVEAPYVGSAVQVFESASFNLLGTCRSLQLDINNSFYGDRGRIVGDTLRNNLRRGLRMVNANGLWQFTDMSLYLKAIQSTSTAMRVLMTSGPYSVQFDFPTFRFIPDQRSSPKANDEGNIEINLGGESEPDVTLGSNVKITLKVPEASIII